MLEKYRAEKKRLEELKSRTPEGRAVPLTFNPTPAELQQLERDYIDANHNVLAAQQALRLSQRGDTIAVQDTIEEMLKKREREREDRKMILQNARWGNRPH